MSLNYRYWSDQLKHCLQQALKFKYFCHKKILFYVVCYWPNIRARLIIYGILCRVNRPIGSFLLLWPTLWALWLAAQGTPDWKILIIFCLGVFLMRSAGCVLNDIADRKIDPLVERTKVRPLARNMLGVMEAFYVAIGILVCAFLLTLLLNSLTTQMACIALILAGIYPFTKRYTYIPQFFLGLAFSWSVPMAFAAQLNTVPKLGWLLVVAVIFWTVVYDTFYAMVDRDDDIKAGIKSTAILFSDMDTIIIGILQCLTLLVLIMVGLEAELGIYYYLGLGIVAILFLYQQYLVFDKDKAKCMRAFRNNGWVGFFIFMGIFGHYL